MGFFQYGSLTNIHVFVKHMQNYLRNKKKLQVLYYPHEQRFKV